MVQLAVSYGLMSLALYTGSYSEQRWHSMARIMACGTVMCIGLGRFAM